MSQPINQRRRTVAESLLRNLGSDFIVANSPDHPLVMRCVDVMAGGRAGLTAIMMSTAEEVRRPALFSARLTLNMMALPPYTNFVYIDAGESAQLQRSSFAAVLGVEDRHWREELTEISANPRRLRQTQVAEKSQRASESRFANTYRLARILQHRNKWEVGLDDRRISRSPARDMLANNIEGAFFHGVPSLPAITNLTLEGARRWYDATDGEPVPVDMPAGAAFVDRYPEFRGDPDKVLRAAAFAGWVVSPSRSERSMEEVSELVSRFTRLK